MSKMEDEGRRDRIFSLVTMGACAIALAGAAAHLQETVLWWASGFAAGMVSAFAIIELIVLLARIRLARALTQEGER